ncbi:MAG: hypothetical protein J6R38_03930 [Alistipes sp.]|jgi:hypothetical protein|nr:hypothetical protein [Alistipes sp.]
MKHFRLKAILLAMLLLFTNADLYAHTPSEVENKVRKICEKYEDTKGVDAMIIVKGEGLEFFKMMMRKEFGKTFMKGVECIGFIEYGKASSQVADALKKELEPCYAMLEEIDLTDAKEIDDTSHIKCYIKRLDSTKLSDFMLVMEDTVTYMSGEITME